MAIAKAVRVVTLGSMIDTLTQLRGEKKVAADVVKAIDAKIDALEEDIMARLDKEETPRSTGRTATVSIGESVVGTLEDADKFFEYVRKNNYFHLFQRRLSDPALRELWESGKKIPGVVPFTKRKLNYTALKGA